MSDLVKPSSSAPYLLSLISKNELDPKKLSAHQRRVCIRFLLQERKHTQRQIAAILRVHESVVSVDKRRIQEQNTWMLDSLDERKLAVEMILTAEEASARLFRDGKVREAWQVQKECLEVLQSLGYIHKKPLVVEGMISFQEMAKIAVREIDPFRFRETNGSGGSGRELPQIN